MQYTVKGTLTVFMMIWLFFFWSFICKINKWTCKEKGKRKHLLLPAESWETGCLLKADRDTELLVSLGLIFFGADCTNMIPYQVVCGHKAWLRGLTCRPGHLDPISECLKGSQFLYFWSSFSLMWILEASRRWSSHMGLVTQVGDRLSPGSSGLALTHIWRVKQHTEDLSSTSKS